MLFRNLSLLALLVSGYLPLHGMNQQETTTGNSFETMSEEYGLNRDRKNGLFLSVGVANFFVTPSVGYIRFVTERIFLISYFNYSYSDGPDILASYKYVSRQNIDSERTGYLFAIGPEIAFYKWDWPEAKTLLFGGLLIGYYSFAVNLKPGSESGGRPTPPASVAGSDSWRGIAAGGNIGVHIKKTDGLFFLLAFGLMFGQTREVEFTAVNKAGVTEYGAYKNNYSNYSFTPQITIAIGFAF
jgi:hypothetical protein